MRQFYQKWLRLFLSLLFLTTLFNGIASAQTQQVKVTGIVKDKQGLSLIGVSVKVKGTVLGTQTDANGKFTLNVPPRSVLDFSYIGFLPLEKAVPANGILNITLFEDAKNLSEVVVVGYGTQKRKDITGSVVSVDPKRLESLPNNNLAQALEGAVPGLTVTQNGGGAEGNNASINIRGQRSITASNSPLIILDGIPYNGSLSDINPSDIGSMDILKDASAAAIYGSRGSNGVILITTKRGSTSKPIISYDAVYGIQKIASVPSVLSPEEFYNYKIARNPNAITATELTNYNNKNFTNWLDLSTRTGSRTQNTVSVRGGSESARYYVSASYLDVKGIAINDQFKRLSTKVNLDVDVTKWLTYGTNTTLNYDDRSGLSPTFSGDYSVYTFNPLLSPYQADGKTLNVYPWPENSYYLNPLGQTLVSNSNLAYQLYSTNYLLVKFPFVKGLSYRINTGVQHTEQNNYTYYGLNTRQGSLTQGELNKVDLLENNYTIENILDYTRAFGKHSVGFTGLYSYQNDINTNNTLDAKGFPNDVLTYYQANVALLTTPTSVYTKTALLSQMARLNYSYDSRYLLTVTARRDGYSGFGENKKYGIFPSVALGWNIGNENFMNDVKEISNLKLRVSYGSNGNQAVAPYSTLAQLLQRSYINGTTTAPGYIPGSLGTPTLHWETTNTFNTGVDFGILNGRIQGSIDVYSARTHDLLLQRQISSVQGIRTILQNIGRTANNGIDIGISSTNIKKEKFTWTSNATFSLNRNKILDLYGNGKSDTLNQWFIGHPIQNNFGYVYGGVWQANEDVSKAPQPNVKPGYAKVLDLNGDGKITGPDRTLIGSLVPRFTYGLGNTFKYQNWSFYAFINGVQGVTKDNNTLSDNVATGVERNTYSKNYWTPTNPTNDYYANAQLQVTPQYQPNIYNVHIFQNASYLRIRDLLLSYDFSTKLLSRLKLGRVRAYIEGRNLFIITPWKGFDPEFTSQSGVPLQKEYTVGLNVSL